MQKGLTSTNDVLITANRCKQSNLLAVGSQYGNVMVSHSLLVIRYDESGFITIIGNSDCTIMVYS